LLKFFTSFKFYSFFTSFAGNFVCAKSGFVVARIRRERQNACRGEIFKAKLKAKIEGLASLCRRTAGRRTFPTKITVAENTPFQIEGKSNRRTPITKFDPNFQIETKFFAKQADLICR
jgi:hypothetical protein